MPDKDKYEDMLRMARPASHARPPMPAQVRAAQFLPFKSMTGFEDDIAEAARLTDERVELNEEELLSLGEKLAILAERAGEEPVVRVRYFLPDGRKAGGSYSEVTAPVKKVRLFEKELVLGMGAVIPFADILSLESDLFSWA